MFIDANAREGENFAGFPVLTHVPQNLGQEWYVLSAAGDNAIRERQCADQPFPLATLVAPTASIGVETTVGQGTLVAHHAYIGPVAQVGIGVILNTGCIVEHDCSIGDFTHVSVHATVAGRSRVGRRCMIGAGATVIDGISICDDVVIGAGAVVVDDVVESGTYIGVPAVKISK